MLEKIENDINSYLHSTGLKFISLVAAFVLFMFLCKINFPTEVTVSSFVIFFGINLVLAVAMIIVFMYLYPLAIWMLIQYNKEI